MISSNKLQRRKKLLQTSNNKNKLDQPGKNYNSILNRNYTIIVINEMIKEYVAKNYMKKKYGSSDRHLINIIRISCYFSEMYVYII